MAENFVVSFVLFYIMNIIHSLFIATTDETQVLIKTILRKHIDVLSVYYCRFVSCTL